MSKLPIKTPCVQVCFVDAKAGLCVGCFRNMEELARWTTFSNAERDAVTRALPAREKAYRDSKKPS